jgi:hypothetical protein
MVSVSNALQEIEATAGDSLVNTKKLGQSLTELGMDSKDVEVVVKSFRNLQGGTDDVTLRLKSANKAIEEFNYAKAKTAASKLAPGLQEDSKEF